MATKATVILIDDLDGGAADETVTFALDGAGHEIDLSASNAAAHRSLLAPYISAGRKTKGTAGTAARRPGAQTPAGSAGGPSTTGISWPPAGRSRTRSWRLSRRPTPEDGTGPGSRHGSLAELQLPHGRRPGGSGTYTHPA
jgi:Lsr2